MARPILLLAGPKMSKRCCNGVHRVNTGLITQPEADLPMGLVGFRLTPLADPLWPAKIRPPGPLPHREVFGGTPPPRWVGPAALPMDLRCFLLAAHFPVRESEVPQDSARV